MLEKRTITIVKPIQDIYLREFFKIMKVEGVAGTVSIKVTGNPTRPNVQRRIFIYDEKNDYHDNHFDRCEPIGDCTINVGKGVFDDFRDVTILIGDSI